MSKKHKTGSIAIPYLVTVFIGILVIGGASFFLLKHFGIIDGEKELSEPTPRQVTTTTYEDNHTILFILDEPEQKCSETFVLMRSIPKDKKLVFAGVPANTITVIDGQQASLKESYTNGGESAAVSFINTLFEIEIDRYMKLDSASFIKVCDILGGVTYAVPEEVEGFGSDGTGQFLNAEQIDRFVTYPFFENGESQRAYTASAVISDMVNQSDGVRLADSLDNSFNTVVNMTNTNITAVDYKKRKVAVKNMLERGSSISSFFIIDGTNSEEDFIPNKATIADFKDRFFKEQSE